MNTQAAALAGCAQSLQLSATVLRRTHSPQGLLVLDHLNVLFDNFLPRRAPQVQQHRVQVVLEWWALDRPLVLNCRFPTVDETATTSSPQLSPLTDDTDQLPPPSPNMLSEEEVAELRRLVVRIHVRRESLRGVVPPDEEFQMLSWLTSLRYIATAMGTFVPPPLPVPAGLVDEADLPGPHQVPGSPPAGSIMPSPSLVDSTDLALAADLERDLRELGEVED